LIVEYVSVEYKGVLLKKKSYILYFPASLTSYKNSVYKPKKLQKEIARYPNRTSDLRMTLKYKCDALPLGQASYFGV
jgi:hypothetical protein